MFTESVYANSAAASEPFSTAIGSAVPATGQLFFDFPEEGFDFPAENARPGFREPRCPGFREPKSIVRRLKRIEIRSDDNNPRELGGRELWDTTAQPRIASCDDEQHSPRPLEGGRFGRPIRMGAAMFKLLKSYGISDAEIAQGIAAYSQSRVQQAAS